MVRAGGERAGSAAAEWCVTFDDDGEHRKTARLVSCEPGQGYTVEWVDRPYPTDAVPPERRRVGQQWPPGWVKGVWYVAADPEPVAEIRFLPYARAHVRDERA
jgi:hypothetical protein